MEKILNTTNVAEVEELQRQGKKVIAISSSEPQVFTIDMTPGVTEKDKSAVALAEVKAKQDAEAKAKKEAEEAEAKAAQIKADKLNAKVKKKK